MGTSIVANAFVLWAVSLAGNPTPPAEADGQRWERGLPSDPGYFPIAVWLQAPRMRHVIVPPASISMWDYGKDRPKSSWPS